MGVQKKETHLSCLVYAGKDTNLLLSFFLCGRISSVRANCTSYIYKYSIFHSCLYLLCNAMVGTEKDRHSQQGSCKELLCHLFS